MWITEPNAAASFAVEKGRVITRDGAEFVGIAKLNASTQEAERFALASVAALQLCALVRAGATQMAALERLAGIALDLIEGKDGI